MQKIKENLPDFQKRIKILQESKTKTNDIRNKQFCIPIDKINELKENIINEKIKKDPNLIQNDYEKRQNIIKEDESTTDYVKKKNDISNSSINAYQQNDSSYIQEQSTRDSSNIENSLNSNESIQNHEIEQQEVKMFNHFRSNFYIKHKFFGIYNFLFYNIIYFYFKTNIFINISTTKKYNIFFKLTK